ncbi:MAG: hypothetical protein ABR511_12960 [Acidimicrobiales bacterium]
MRAAAVGEWAVGEWAAGEWAVGEWAVGEWQDGPAAGYLRPCPPGDEARRAARAAHPAARRVLAGVTDARGHAVADGRPTGSLPIAPGLEGAGTGPVASHLPTRPPATPEAWSAGLWGAFA